MRVDSGRWEHDRKDPRSTAPAVNADKEFISHEIACNQIVDKEEEQEEEDNYVADGEGDLNRPAAKRGRTSDI